MEVWVAETWHAHGEAQRVEGVYDSREAAFEGLKAVPDMTVYVDERGHLVGRPRHEREYLARWGKARPMPVLGRMPPPPDVVEEAIVPIERGPRLLSAFRRDRHHAR